MSAPTTTISSLDLIQWLRWAGEGKDEKEQEERKARVERYLFPPGLSQEQKTERQNTVEFVKKFGAPPNWLGFGDPCPPPDEDPNSGRIALPEVPALPSVSPPRDDPPWEGLIPRAAAAYRRGSLHDGTQRQVDRMRSAARGSPFEATKMYDEEEEQKRKERARAQRRRQEEDEED